MLNRSAIIVRPKQPYMDWADDLDESDVLPTTDGENTVYLLREYEDDVDGIKGLSEVYDIIFEKELEAWHLDENDWPTNRNFTLFCKWFDFEFHSMVDDLSDEPIIDDEEYD